MQCVQHRETCGVTMVLQPAAGVHVDNRNVVRHATRLVEGMDGSLPAFLRYLVMVICSYLSKGCWRK